MQPQGQKHNDEHDDNNEQLLIAASFDKLQETASALRRALVGQETVDNKNEDAFPFRLQPTTQPLGYRCRCSFQILIFDDEQADSNDTSAGDKQQKQQQRRRRRVSFAIREEGQPVVIDTFPIANWKIQECMEQLRQELQQQQSSHDNSDDDNILVDHLTSVTFGTSWLPSRDGCLVTLHYNAPPLSSLKQQGAWMDAAQRLVHGFGWRQVTRRSKGQVLRVKNTKAQEGDKEEEEEVQVRDTIYLQKRHRCHNDNDTIEDSGNDRNNNNITHSYCWNVSLDPDELLPMSKSPTTSTIKTTTLPPPIVNVEYRKPESAFAHPNATVMCQALAWILNRVQDIVKQQQQQQQQQQQPLSTTTVTLLELYCGCGAHTMALARSGLLHQIVAVELDERLVQACRNNAKLNNIHINTAAADATGSNSSKTPEENNDEDDIATTATSTTTIEIISQDAGVWSLAATSTAKSSSSSLPAVAAVREASILLVDPPRQGLDERVCHMAMEHENLQHVLYISCGREALVRDLQILDKTFEVVDCVLTDLFPQTYSVESLAYLRKRGTT